MSEGSSSICILDYCFSKPLRFIVSSPWICGVWNVGDGGPMRSRVVGYGVWGVECGFGVLVNLSTLLTHYIHTMDCK